MRIIATGNFDGVHRGHQKILQVLRQEANQAGLPPLAVTYNPHTRHFLGTMGEPPLLSPMGEKRILFSRQGIPMEALPFDATLAALSGPDFVEKIILGRLDAKVWIFGPNHRFGAGGKGNIEEAQKAFPQLRILQVDPELIDGEPVSSTRIRDALQAGDCLRVSALLGHPYSLLGEVVHGDARGRTLGFPTANLKLEPYKLLPPFGVYAGIAEFNGICKVAVVNVGLRPTFAGQDASIEVHIPDWSGDLYGKRLEMKLNLKLRGEMRFTSPQELVAQIACDVQRAKSAVKLDSCT